MFRNLTHIVLLILTLVSCLFLGTRLVRAQNFKLSISSDYQFHPDFSTTVTKKIAMINLNTNTYASLYVLDVPNDAANVLAFDKKGKTKVTISQDTGTKRAQIQLNETALGEGNATSVVVSFDTNELIKKDQETFHITIPGFSTQESMDSYTISLSFPPEWGEPKRIIPAPKVRYQWDLSLRPETQITLSFGTEPTPSVVPSDIVPVSYVHLVGGIAFGIILFTLIAALARRILT